MTAVLFWSEHIDLRASELSFLRSVFVDTCSAFLPVLQCTDWQLGKYLGCLLAAWCNAAIWRWTYVQCTGLKASHKSCRNEKAGQRQGSSLLSFLDESSGGFQPCRSRGFTELWESASSRTCLQRKDLEMDPWPLLRELRYRTCGSVANCTKTQTKSRPKAGR